jgi:hypothetical protein
VGGPFLFWARRVRQKKIPRSARDDKYCRACGGEWLRDISVTEEGEMQGGSGVLHSRLWFEDRVGFDFD